MLAIPEPVVSADADFNRVITLDEFKQAARERFQLLDKAHQGRLTLAELEAMLPKLKYRHPHDPSHAPDHIVSSLIGPSLATMSRWVRSTRCASTERPAARRNAGLRPT